jgi:hypothetical protein
MKNVFAKIALASFVGLPSLLAAEALGVVPSIPLSVEMIVGGYVAAGVLAFAWKDYGRAATRGQPSSRKASRSPSAARPAHPDPLLTWSHQTMSA